MQAGNSLKKYGDYFVQQKEFKVNAITADDLAEAIKRSPDNATGLDGVAASDLRLLRLSALTWLAKMYAAIERGAHWPEQVLVGRTAWLDKTESP